MTPAEFKMKWSRYSGKETSAYQGHFDDLCRLLEQPTPAEADPSGSDFFCFQKRVVKDTELFELHETGVEAEPGERGFADVWRKGCFAWEYKGKKKNLDEAYKQLLRYRESLLNPPLLVVCDFDRYIVRTNFNGTVQEVHEFNNDQIDRPENLRILRALFENPDFLKPQRTTAQVTEKLAEQIAEVGRSLQGRKGVELEDARTRKEFRVTQKENLRIARFLNRIIFCLFADDTGLLPPKLFSEVARAGLEDPHLFAELLEELFRVMAKGGNFGTKPIRHFNGHLFEEATVFELTEAEIARLAEAAEADWQFIQPSIMGTLFERAIEPEQRSQLGAHYTSEADIRTLVEPVLMAPIRREWSELKSGLAGACVEGKGTPAQRDKLAAFQQKLAAMTVLDPACGSGNFLYVSLQLLLELEKEVITCATLLGFKLAPKVSVQQLRAIEINPYAFELAQVTVQIGYLQWRRDNGFDNDHSPVLQNLGGFQNEDALLVPHFRNKAKTLKEAQAGEHKGDDALKFYTEREWPKCDVIVSNPPFLGGGMVRSQIGDHYVGELFRMFSDRLPNFSDLCCYWFEKARDQIATGKCRRAGLLATQGIRGGANREVLKRIKDSGEMFFAISDRDWVLDGANVHVSLIGFDDGSEKQRTLNGQPVETINANLTGSTDTTTANQLNENLDICFMGPSPKAPFDVSEDIALPMILDSANAHRVANSDVVRPVQSAVDLAQKSRREWTLDFASLPFDSAARYEKPFAYVRVHVYPVRSKNSRQTNAEWWQYERPRVDMRKAMIGFSRFITTPGVSKHRIYVWRTPETLCNQGTLVFARDDDYFFGLVHSYFHQVWALAQGTQLREKESGFRYTPTTCFETFPFPRPTPAQEGAIAAAAKELNELRERWLNPPEWTRTEFLEFPASVDGPWARYVDCGGKRDATPLSPASGAQSAVAAHALPAHSRIGLARYPRLVPRDADCAAKLKKRTLTNLYNERPAWLDLAHKRLDAAVAAAYGWPADLSDENILEKLLALNLGRAAEEIKAGKSKKPEEQREKAAHEMI